MQYALYAFVDSFGCLSQGLGVCCGIGSVLIFLAVAFFIFFGAGFFLGGFLEAFVILSIYPPIIPAGLSGYSNNVNWRGVVSCISGTGGMGVISFISLLSFVSCAQ